MQFHPLFLDALIAPEFSALTACEAPEIEALPDYSTKFFLNNLFVALAPDDARPVIIMFLRHLSLAFEHYRDGRLGLLECVRAEQHSAPAVSAYLRALSQFENAVLRAHLAVACNHAVALVLDPANTSKTPYDSEGRTKEARLRDLANRLKHFDEDVAKRSAGNRPVPVWIANNGLRCRQVERLVDLSFVELTELLEELRQNAHWLAETSYAEARERREARRNNPEGSTEI